MVAFDTWFSLACIKKHAIHIFISPRPCNEIYMIGLNHYRNSLAKLVLEQRGMRSQLPIHCVHPG